MVVCVGEEDNIVEFWNTDINSYCGIMEGGGMPWSMTKCFEK